jgi:hypothetical protein
MEDLKFVGAFRTGCTENWRLESVNINVHMNRGQALNDLSYKFKAACPEWRAERTALIRGWIVADMQKAR